MYQNLTRLAGNRKIPCFSYFYRLLKELDLVVYKKPKIRFGNILSFDRMIARIHNINGIVDLIERGMTVLFHDETTF